MPDASSSSDASGGSLPEHDPMPDDPLLDHVEALHVLAQSVTATAPAAARLVEATYRRAAALPPAERPARAGRLWLFRLMHEEREASSAPADLREKPPAKETEPSTRSFRQQAAQRAVRRVLPAAFAALPEQDRFLLTLCLVEQLACADAGDVLGLPPKAACDRLDRARLSLRTALRENAAPAERALLDAALPERALADALRRFAASEFAASPPALREVVAATAARPAETAPASERAAGDRGAASSSRTSSSGKMSGRGRLKRGLAALLLIAVSGLAGYATVRLFTPQPTTDLVALTAEQPGAVGTVLETSSPDEAARFVRSELGRRLAVPSIEGAPLSGVGLAEVAEGVRVPAFLFSDTTDGQDLALYAYTYALLDRYDDRLRLDADLLDQISVDGAFGIAQAGGRAVLLWRRRDDIFVAVTPGDAEALRRRIAS